jgi:hypothetical protein
MRRSNPTCFFAARWIASAFAKASADKSLALAMTVGLTAPAGLREARRNRQRYPGRLARGEAVA